MVTAYSPILKLALPVQGELSGTWGDVVNDNITSMVEQAIAGRAVIDTWTTNSHTLTTADGTTSESRCAMLEFTDTGTALSGAGTVICPTLSKIYIAKNASGQNVTLKTSGGTGILVPNGRTMFLFCDGTNVVEAVTSTTSLQLGTSTIVTAVLDEDNMASDSATSLATQQSIKAYVDSQVGANNELSEVLANGNTSGANDIIMTSGQKITTNTIDETTAASGVTIDSVLLKDDGVNATNLEITNIKANDGTAAGSIADSTGVVTILSSILTTADINGGTADGVIIGGTTPAAATVTNLIANTDLIIAGTTTITAVLDEDNMASDSATALATQQSIKAYVDSQVGTVDTLAEILAIGNTTGATDIAVDSAQKVQFRDAAIYINSSVDGQLDIVADTEIQIAATTVDLNGNLDVSGTALVTGVLTTTAATVSNGGGQFNGAINVGVDDTGYDVKFFGATAGAYMLWDESADDLILGGAAGLSVNSTALVTGVLTTTAATVHTGGITMPDNAKAIFGDSSDLQIYHTGTYSLIADTSGTGPLRVVTNTFQLNNAADTQNMIAADEGGAVTLYHNNAAKIATTATGIDVTGAAQISYNGVDTYLYYQSTSNYTGRKTDGNMWMNVAGGQANVFGISGVEKVRIDSSGNLLVGKTASNSTVAGSQLNANGLIIGTTSETNPLLLNRLSTDGDIILMQKDGTTVGSIASRAGVVSTIILDPSSPGGGISGGGSALYPTDHAGTLSDGVLTLGDASARWNNLYLSGGVYLGGTVAANYLDDYEEGTWTPTWIVASGSITANSNTSGRYTKIGRVVSIMGYISYESNSSASGTVTVGGLPFTSVTSGFGQSSNQAGGVTSFATVLFASNAPNVGRIDANNTIIRPNITGSNGGTELQFSNFSLSTNHSQFVFQGQYIVNT
jgi:hypothetical protein